MALPQEVTSVTGCNLSDVISSTTKAFSNDTGLEAAPDYIPYFNNIYRTIYVVGLLGNIFAVSVWFFSRLRLLAVLYFQAICVVDSLVLLLHPLETFHAVHVEGVCQLVHVLFLAVQVLAICLVLGLTVERFIELVLPLWAEALVSCKRTKRCILLLTLGALLCSSVEAYVWYVEDGQCQLRHSASQSFMWTYTIIVLLFLFTIPLVVVLVLNVLIHYKVQRRRRNSVAFGNAMVPDRHKLNRSVAILCCYLATCEITYAVVHTHQYFIYGQSDNDEVVNSTEAGAKTASPLMGRWHSYHVNSLPLLILDVLTLTSYAVDVAVFTLFSKTFRHQVQELYKRCGWCCGSSRRPPRRSPPVFTTNGHVAA